MRGSRMNLSYFSSISQNVPCGTFIPLTEFLLTSICKKNRMTKVFLVFSGGKTVNFDSTVKRPLERD